MFSVRLPQESVKTKHPQLLYESKLYKILQGGSESVLVLALHGCACFAACLCQDAVLMSNQKMLGDYLCT